MATTTNYGWTTPDDTALVKDGASAIRTLGTSVDTTTKNLNPETTLGDIAYRSSTSNVNTRLGIGSTGNVLTVSGGVPAWAAPTASGLVPISSTTFSNVASHSVNNCFSATYLNYYIVYEAVSTTGSQLGLQLRVAGVTATATDYQFATVSFNSNSSTGSFGDRSTASPYMNLGEATASNKTNGFATIFNPFGAEVTRMINSSVILNTNAFQKMSGNTHSLATSYDGLTLLSNTGNITGYVKVYGVANA
jgi:hypothetical protein